MLSTKWLRLFKETLANLNLGKKGKQIYCLLLNRPGEKPHVIYFTSLGLSWDTLLKMTNIKLELVHDIDMSQLIEKGMRGGVPYILLINMVKQIISTCKILTNQCHRNT